MWIKYREPKPEVCDCPDKPYLDVPKSFTHPMGMPDGDIDDLWMCETCCKVWKHSVVAAKRGIAGGFMDKHTSLVHLWVEVSTKKAAKILRKYEKETGLDPRLQGYRNGTLEVPDGSLPRASSAPASSTEMTVEQRMDERDG